MLAAVYDPYYLYYFLFFLGQFELDNLRKELNKINKQIAQLKIVSFFNKNNYVVFYYEFLVYFFFLVL